MRLNFSLSHLRSARRGACEALTSYTTPAEWISRLNSDFVPSSSLDGHGQLDLFLLGQQGLPGSRLEVEADVVRLSH